jgi:hypothetical protein
MTSGKRLRCWERRHRPRLYADAANRSNPSVFTSIGRLYHEFVRSRECGPNPRRSASRVGPRGKLPLARPVGGSLGPHCVTPSGSLALSRQFPALSVARPPRAAARHGSGPLRAICPDNVVLKPDPAFAARRQSSAYSPQPPAHRRLRPTAHGLRPTAHSLVPGKAEALPRVRSDISEALRVTGAVPMEATGDDVTYHVRSTRLVLVGRSWHCSCSPTV